MKIVVNKDVIRSNSCDGPKWFSSRAVTRTHSICFAAHESTRVDLKVSTVCALGIVRAASSVVIRSRGRGDEHNGPGRRGILRDKFGGQYCVVLKRFATSDANFAVYSVQIPCRLTVRGSLELWMASKVQSFCETAIRICGALRIRTFCLTFAFLCRILSNKSNGPTKILCSQSKTNIVLRL